MKLRQGVISIYASDGVGGFLPVPEKNIIFYQPYHKFGLSYSFSFEKNYFSPITDCQIVINNPDNSIGEAIAFEYTKPYTRPIVRIWAGYSDYRLLRFTEPDINNLKATLNEIYAGFPIFYSDDKVGAANGAGRELLIRLTDVSLQGSKRRINKLFSAGTLIVNIVLALIRELGINADISDLLANRNFQQLKIEQDIYYSSRFILEDVLPDLERQYNFSHFSGNTGDLIFKVLDDQGTPAGAAANEISNSNGMIGFANTSNWVDVELKTLFGRPDIFYPGDRVSIVAPNLNPVQNTEGLILKAGYSWNDQDAEISYTVNTFGQPANPFPIKRF